MAIKKQNYLYEVMLRFGPKGFRASHQIQVDRYFETDTGDTLSEQQRAAEPLEASEISDLLGAQVASLIDQVNALNTKIEEHNQQEV